MRLFLIYFMLSNLSGDNISDCEAALTGIYYNKLGYFIIFILLIIQKAISESGVDLTALAFIKKLKSITSFSSSQRTVRLALVIFMCGFCVID